MDFAAWVLYITPPWPVHIHQHLGGATQQFVSHILGKEDTRLNSVTHPSGGGKLQIVPYTTAGLFGYDNSLLVGCTIVPGQTVRLRITLLNQDMCAAFEKWAIPSQRRPPTHVEIDRIPWRVVHFSHPDSGEPWAAQTSISALLHAAEIQTSRSDFRVRFVSPTTFKSSGTYLPLPVPTRVFESLLDRWGVLAGIPLPDAVQASIQRGVCVSYCNIQTTTVYLPDNVRAAGFTGDVHFTMGLNDTFTDRDKERNKELQDQAKNLSRALALLIDFGAFCGVGAKTTQGMGMMLNLGSG